MFPGLFKEDLDSTINDYEKLVSMCQENTTDMIKAIPVMLLGDGLIFATHGTFRKAMKKH